MRDSIKISLPQPCSERWDNFTTTSHGGFCGSCSKTVVDFTSMDDAAILKFFAGKEKSAPSSHGHVCGRFRPDQLKAYQIQTLPKFRPGLTLLRAGIVGIMIVLAGQPSWAQQVEPKHATQTEQSRRAKVGEVTVSDGVTLSGVVKEGETGDTVPGVNVVLKGTPTGTITDSSGRFEFPAKLHGNDVLVFSFIGFAAVEYVVANESKDLDIEMTLDPDITVLGAVAVDEPYKAPRGLNAVWNKVKSIF